MFREQCVGDFFGFCVPGLGINYVDCAKLGFTGCTEGPTPGCR